MCIAFYIRIIINQINHSQYYVRNPLFLLKLVSGSFLFAKKIKGEIDKFSSVALIIYYHVIKFTIRRC